MLIRYYLRYDGANTGDCCCYELYFLNFDATFSCGKYVFFISD